MFSSLDAMQDTFTIGRLAAEAGVQTSTIRYYERAGLLEPPNRTDGNYRIYSRDALERVRFIRVAQAAGFRLDDIATLLNIRDGVAAPCEEVETLIEHRIADVRKRLDDLNEVDKHLKHFLRMCRDSAGKNRCEVLVQLTEKSTRSF